MSTDTRVKYVAYHCIGVLRAEVSRFVEFNAGVLVGEYVEGKRKWPKLVEAIERLKQEGATLVIAKIGRRAHNPKFLALLQGAQIDFACLDNQTCNRFTVHILVATAEEESERISQRTRKSLREAVERTGMKLGSARPGHWEGREHLRGTKKAIAASAKARTQPHSSDLRFPHADFEADAAGRQDHGRNCCMAEQQRAHHVVGHALSTVRRPPALEALPR